MKLMQQVFFQCSSQMIIMSDVFLPILEDQADFQP